MTTKTTDTGNGKYIKSVSLIITIIVLLSSVIFSYAINESKIESNREDIIKFTANQEDLKEEVDIGRVNDAVEAERFKNITIKLDKIENMLEQLMRSN